jgi:hypothetical protein
MIAAVVAQIKAQKHKTSLINQRCLFAMAANTCLHYVASICDIDRLVEVKARLYGSCCPFQIYLLLLLP